VFAAFVEHFFDSIGQTEKNSAVHISSALPPKADIGFHRPIRLRWRLGRGSAEEDELMKNAKRANVVNFPRKPVRAKQWPEPAIDELSLP
jgi:hypothetical protein